MWDSIYDSFQEIGQDKLANANSKYEIIDVEPSERAPRCEYCFPDEALINNCQYFFPAFAFFHSFLLFGAFITISPLISWKNT